ncbi:MAG: hypothetical protein LBT27_02190 [Prevotellaceae bacterium]|nr:hypothetical protein [Prevotellaceae bacterium]
MKAKKFVAERCCILFASLFISVATLAQDVTLAQDENPNRNALGLLMHESHLEVLSVKLEHFPDREEQKIPDKTYSFGFYTLNEMHQLSQIELNVYIYEHLRFEGDKIFATSAGAEERQISIIVNPEDMYIPEGNKNGKATLICEGFDAINVEYNQQVIEGLRACVFKYSFREQTGSDAEGGSYTAEVTYLMK